MLWEPMCAARGGGELGRKFAWEENKRTLAGVQTHTAFSPLWRVRSAWAETVVRVVVSPSLTVNNINNARGAIGLLGGCTVK